MKWVALKQKTMIFTAISLVFVLLSGCAHYDGTETKLTLRAVQYLNPDISGKPSPVVVSIYELKSPFAFKQASYNQLNTNTSALLGTMLIDKQAIEIRPGEEKKKTKYLTPNSHYLGITVAYRNIDQANWRKIIELPHQAKKVKITLNLESQGLITKVGE